MFLPSNICSVSFVTRNSWTTVAAVYLLQAYIAEQLKTTLVKGLTVLAREKPTSNKLEAITFLANWMLDNNPNKPQTVVPPELQEQVKEQQARRQAAVAATRTVVPLQSACSAPRLPIACTNQQVCACRTSPCVAMYGRCESHRAALQWRLCLPGKLRSC